jgi:hypothetical protein
MKTKKLDKICCEICQCKDIPTLHYHHIIPRTDIKCTNDWLNLCVICSNCHNKVHSDVIKIVGVYPSTKMPYKRTLIFEENGISNMPDITEPYCEAQENSMKVYL